MKWSQLWTRIIFPEVVSFLRQKHPRITLPFQCERGMKPLIEIAKKENWQVDISTSQAGSQVGRNVCKPCKSTIITVRVKPTFPFASASDVRVWFREGKNPSQPSFRARKIFGIQQKKKRFHHWDESWSAKQDVGWWNWNISLLWHEPCLCDKCLYYFFEIHPRIRQQKRKHVE